MFFKFAMSNEQTKIEVRDLRQGDWLWMHKNVLFSQYISASDFKVYSGLASFADNRNQQSFPSIITLATRLNLSRQTVIKALKWLEELQVITVERKDGIVNVYCLLSVVDIVPPQAPTRDQSAHHQLVETFHKACISGRKVKPTFSIRDVMQLKRALKTGILSNQQIEQLMIYFLCSPRFVKYSPSLATFFSSGIFNGLMNTMQNDRNFWKDLDQYTSRIFSERSRVPIKLAEMNAMMEELKKKMTFTSSSLEYAR